MKVERPGFELTTSRLQVRYFSQNITTPRHRQDTMPGKYLTYIHAGWAIKTGPS